VKHVNIAHRRKGQSSSYEGMLVSKTGKKIPVLLSGTPTADGGTIGIITDLTSFKQKEQRELILSRALLLSSDGIIVVDEKGRIETWNKGAKVMFGYREADIVGKTVGTLFPDIAVTDFLGNKSIDGSHELRARHKNGHVITVALTISPVRTRKANDLSAILIMRDATATRKFSIRHSTKKDD
jgi:PAS domain S-box-containing protein